MKAITKWKAEDGTIFDAEQRCTEYEAICTRVAQLEATTLGARHRETGFANGKGYIQHTRQAVDDYTACLRTLLIRFYPDHADSFPLEALYNRMSSDIVGGRTLSSALNRTFCIDGQCREWGQPYFALNPGKGEQFEVTP